MESHNDFDNRIVYKYITEYINSQIQPNRVKIDELYKNILYKDKLTEIENSFVVPIRPEVMKLIEVLLHILKPQKILEIGTGFGYSAICIQKTSGATVHTIEKNVHNAEIAQENIDRFGLKHNIKVIVGDSDNEINTLIEMYDFILLDGSKGQYIKLLDRLLSKLRTGGVLFADNVLYHGAVANNKLVDPKKRSTTRRLQEFIKQICFRIDLTTSIVPIGDGVSISYKL